MHLPLKQLLETWLTKLKLRTWLRMRPRLKIKQQHRMKHSQVKLRTKLLHLMRLKLLNKTKPLKWMKQSYYLAVKMLLKLQWLTNLQALQSKNKDSLSERWLIKVVPRLLDHPVEQPQAIKLKLAEQPLQTWLFQRELLIRLSLRLYLLKEQLKVPNKRISSDMFL